MARYVLVGEIRFGPICSDLFGYFDCVFAMISSNVGDFIDRIASLPANGSTISSSTVGLVSSVVSLVQRTNWWNDDPKKRLPRGFVPMA